MPSVVIPTMRYRDAGRMIDWLGGAFGFERRMVIDDGSGGIAHAELTFGDGMIMLGRRATTTSASCSRRRCARRHDAEPVHRRCRRRRRLRASQGGGSRDDRRKPQQSYGRDFSCRDPEGHLWNLGDYNPWTYTAARARRPASRSGAHTAEALDLAPRVWECRRPPTAAAGRARRWPVPALSAKRRDA